MRFAVRLSMVLTAAVLLSIPKLSSAGTPAPASSAESQAIITVLNQQADDWNRGDLDAFAKGYKNSPDILFMGPTIRRGYDQMLQGYRKSFPNREAMGKLTFSNLEVQPLDQHFATVTGRFRLDRTAAGGGPASGYYLLVVEKTPLGWKIIRDATTDSPRPAH